MERIEREIKRELRRFSPAGGIADVVDAWATAVGETIAANAWPARISRDGTLHVAARSSTWAFELGQLAPEVLARLREKLGESAPTAIRFTLGQVPDAVTETPEKGFAKPLQPSVEDVALAAKLAAGIGDAELRERVAKAAALSLARAAAVSTF